MTAVSLNIGIGVRLIKPANLYMCTQTHYKNDEDGCTALGVRGHGSVPMSHSGKVVMRIGLHTNKSYDIVLRTGFSHPSKPPKILIHLISWI